LLVEAALLQYEPILMNFENKISLSWVFECSTVPPCCWPIGSGGHENPTTSTVKFQYLIMSIGALHERFDAGLL
jgi:hypothetical protein